MADLRELLVLFGTDERPDAEHLNEESIDKLMEALSEVGVTSPLDLRLWFDGDGEDLLSEIREITKQVNHSKAVDTIKMAIYHVRECPLDALNVEAVPVPARPPLRKRKLVMGRMVIDREAELASSSMCRRPVVPVFPSQTVQGRMATARNVQVVNATVAKFQRTLPISKPCPSIAPVGSMLQKETEARNKVVGKCWDLMKRIGKASARYVVLTGNVLHQSLLDTQEDLFLGRRQPSVVGRYVKDMSEFLDWIESIGLAFSGVDSFYVAA